MASHGTWIARGLECLGIPDSRTLWHNMPTPAVYTVEPTDHGLRINGPGIDAEPLRPAPEMLVDACRRTDRGDRRGSVSSGCSPRQARGRVREPRSCGTDEWINAAIFESDSGSGVNRPGSGSFHPKMVGHYAASERVAKRAASQK